LQSDPFPPKLGSDRFPPQRQRPMSNPDYSPSDLEAYFDESLPVEEMNRVEKALRESDALRDQLAAISARRDAGVHSLGAIWRRHRLTCLSREQLGSYLLGTADDHLLRYVDFHLDTVGCRYCRANLIDLEKRHQEETNTTGERRRKYFQSSAGFLRR